MAQLCEVVITAPDPGWLKNFSRTLIEQRLCASAPRCRQCLRCHCSTSCWPVSRPPVSPPVPVWLPKSDTGRGA